MGNEYEVEHRMCIRQLFGHWNHSTVISQCVADGSLLCLGNCAAHGWYHQHCSVFYSRTVRRAGTVRIFGWGDLCAHWALRRVEQSGVHPNLFPNFSFLYDLGQYCEAPILHGSLADEKQKMVDRTSDFPDDGGIGPGDFGLSIQNG